MSNMAHDYIQDIKTAIRNNELICIEHIDQIMRVIPKDQLEKAVVDIDKFIAKDSKEGKNLKHAKEKLKEYKYGRLLE